MNDFRHLMAVGILITGILGLGAPAAFAGSSENWKADGENQCPNSMQSSECKSKTPDEKSGTTVYHYRGRYFEINNGEENNRTLVALFYRNAPGFRYVTHGFCDRVNHRECGGRLPQGENDSICMKTGVLKEGGKLEHLDDHNYDFGDYRCFALSS